MPPTIAIAAASWALLALISLGYALRMRPSRAIPMQWGLNGEPVWSAPLWLALLFTPLLSVLVMGLTVWLTYTAVSALVIIVITLQAVTFLAAHLVHLEISRRQLQRRENG